MTLVPGGLWTNAAWTLRSWRRRPAAPIVVIAILALGLGANGAIANTIEQILFRPPPGVAASSQLVRISTLQFLPAIGSVEAETLPYALASELLSDSTVLAGGTAFLLRTVTVLDSSSTRRMRVAYVAPSYFSALGAQTVLGRAALLDSSGRSVVLSYAYWRNHFGASASTLGRKLRINGQLYEINDVAASGFSGVDLSRIDLWAPLEREAQLSIGSDWRTNAHAAFVTVVVRVRDGVSRQAAAMRLTQILKDYEQRTARVPLDSRVIIEPQLRARGAERRTLQDAAVVLSAISLLLLLVAAANAFAFLEARWIELERSFAVQLALGASYRHVLARLWGEVVLVGVLGTLAGLLVARLVNTAVRLTIMPEVAWAEVRFPPAAMIAAYCCLILGVGSVALVRGKSRLGRLTASVVGYSPSTSSARYTRWRSLHLGFQATVAVILITGAFLFLATFQRLIGAQLGFDAAGILVADFADARGESDREQAARLDRFKRSVMTLPGVVGASLSSDVPFRRSSAVASQISGRGPVLSLATGGPYVTAVDEGFIATMGAEVLYGRGFVANDITGSNSVVIVNQTMMDFAWHGENPVGACIKLLNEPSCREVVGVVRDLKRSTLLEPPTLRILVPYTKAEGILVPNVVFVRAAGAASDVQSAVTRAVLSHGYDISGVAIEPLSDLMHAELTTWRLSATVFSAYGVVTVLIAALALFSSFGVVMSARRKEIAIRTAIGAPTRSIISLIAYPVVRDTALGVAIGVVFVFLTWERLPQLTGAKQAHVALSTVGAAVFVVVAVVICLILIAPQRRIQSRLLRDLR